MDGFLKNLFEKEKKIKVDDKCDTPMFLINHFISFRKDSIFASLDVAKYHSLPQWAQMLLLYHLTPKSGKWFFTKGSFVKKKKKPELIIKNISIHFNCSSRHAEEIFELLELQKVDVISAFGHLKL